MLVAWQYGLLPPLSDGEYAWAADCEYQMERQIDLWNRLVAIEQQRRAAERSALTAGNLELTVLWDEFDRVLTELEALPRREQRRVELSRRRHELWVGLKPLQKAAREAHGDELRHIADERYAAVTAARNASGLWWGNYNAVCASFDVALGRLEPGDRLRPRRWYGAGRLTNQIQGGITAAVLQQRGHVQVSIEPMPPGHPALRRGAGANRRARREDGWVRQLKLLVATVYSAGRGTRRLAAWPLVLHRDFPPAAVVKSVAIHRRRINRAGPLEGTRGNPFDWRWTVTFSCEVDEIAPSPSLLACGIDIGWRKLESGIRVATIASDAGPNGVAIEHITVDQDWLDRRAALAELFGAARVLGDRPDKTGDEERQWRRMRARYAHGIDQINAERREDYRRLAKRIARSYGHIIIDATGSARLARRKRAEDEGQDAAPESNPWARRQRSWCAPASLIAEIERAARSHGCAVELAQGKSTVRCALCGHANSYSAAERQQLILQCAGCGLAWDQDENAARNLLAAAGDASAAAALRLARRQNKGLKRARMTRKKSARKAPDNRLETPPP